MKKTCPQCGEHKNTSNFYRDRSKPDGLTSTCKMCRKLAQKDYRKNHQSSVKHYEDERRKQQERKKYSREYQQQYRHINKIRVDKYDKRSIARKMVNNAVAKKLLNKPTVCEISPTIIENVQYHHPNYDYQFVVVALCHDIHEIIHKKHIYNSVNHDKIRRIVELIGKRREQYYDKHGLAKYLYAMNQGTI